MLTLSYLQENILLDGPDDACGLWQIVADVKRTCAVSDWDEVRRLAMTNIRPLLIGGYVEACALGLDCEFVPWPEQGEAAAARIDGEWRRLGRDPTVWEVAWLMNTDIGNDAARQIVQARESDSGSNPSVGR